MMTQMLMAVAGYILTALSITTALATKQCEWSFDSSLQMYNVSCQFSQNLQGSLLTVTNHTNSTEIFKLDLSLNNISQIPDNFFTGISSIRKLNLSKNMLTAIPRIPKNLKNLTLLNLSYNMLKVANVSMLADITNLQHLDLSHNLLKSTNLSHVPFSVKTLDLSYNVLQEFSTGSLRSTNLQVLDLSANHLKHLDGLPIPNLKSLDLGQNQLQILPESLLKSLSSLEKLKISQNNITHLPEHTFIHLNKLVSLDLSDNGLEAIPDGMLLTIQNLKYLNVSGNKLKSLTDLSFAGADRALQVLDLSRNSITSISSNALNILNMLHTITLQQNPYFQKIKNVKLPMHLEFLDLSHCSITQINNCNFQHLQDLRSVRVEGNRLSCSCNLFWFYEWVRYLRRNAGLNSNRKWMCTGKTNKTVKLDLLKSKCSNYTFQMKHCTVTRRDVNITFNISITTDKRNLDVEWIVTKSVYGFVVVITDSDGKQERTRLSKYSHGYTKIITKNFASFNVCIQALQNKTSVLVEKCQMVHFSSMEIIVGILAGSFALIPCLAILIWILCKDKHIRENMPANHLPNQSSKLLLRDGSGEKDEQQKRQFSQTLTNPNTVKGNDALKEQINPVFEEIADAENVENACDRDQHANDLAAHPEAVKNEYLYSTKL